MLRYVAHAGSKVLDSSDPSASASQVTETIGACPNNLARNYWTLDRVYGHQMPQFVELTFRIETYCLVRICFYRKGGKCDPQICWRVTWLHENYRWNLQRDAVNPGIESSKKSSRFPFLSADCPEEPRTCRRKSQVNSEHCLNAPLLRWGTTGQFTASFTRFLHKLSRGGIQRRADTGPCGFGIQWKAHRVFRLFYFLSLPSQIKGRPPEYFLLSLDRRCWVSSPAQSQDLEVREKSEASGQHIWGPPSLVLLASSPPLKTQATAVQPQHCLCLMGSSQEQHPRARGLCNCWMPWGWGERGDSDPRMH